MAGLKKFCMSVTPFAKTGEVDEQALRELLRGFISLNFGVLLGSGGEGEGHALEPDEARRIYERGVEECAGKVPVYANLPEEMTARATIQRAQLAVDAGIDVIHIYTIEGRHGMKPSDAELMTYFDDVFAIVKRPVGIAINAGIGYIAKAEIIADVCHRHPQVVELRLTHVPDTYFIKLKSMVRRPVKYYYQFASGPFNPIMLGVDGIFGSEANIIPKTCARFIELCDARRYDEIGAVYAQIRRFADYVSGFGRPTLRAVKMCMKLLKLPGDGALRRPYLMPPDSELGVFSDGLLKLRVPEIDELARVAGLQLPA